MTEHLPGRPHWHCTGCGDHWPCPPARRHMLATAHRIDNLAGLRLSLLATQAEAESDFEHLGTLKEHGDLHDRFVAWTTSRADNDGSLRSS